MAHACCCMLTAAALLLTLASPALAKERGQERPTPQHMPCNATRFVTGPVTVFLDQCAFLVGANRSAQTCPQHRGCMDAYAAISTGTAAVCLYSALHDTDAGSKVPMDAAGVDIDRFRLMFTFASARCRVADGEHSGGLLTGRCGASALAVFKNHELDSFFRACAALRGPANASDPSSGCTSACRAAWATTSKHACLSPYVKELRGFIAAKPHDVLARDRMVLLDSATERCGAGDSLTHVADECHEAEYAEFVELSIPRFLRSCRDAYEPDDEAARVCSAQCADATRSAMAQPACLLRWDAAEHRRTAVDDSLEEGSEERRQAVAEAQRARSRLKQQLQRITATHRLCAGTGPMDTLHHWRRTVHASARRAVGNPTSFVFLVMFALTCCSGLVYAVASLVRHEVAGQRRGHYTLVRRQRHHAE